MSDSQLGIIVNCNWCTVAGGCLHNGETFCCSSDIFKGNLEILIDDSFPENTRAKIELLCDFETSKLFNELTSR